MNREIKFRAFDEDRKKMVYEFADVYDINLTKIFTNEENEIFAANLMDNSDWQETKLMQYIGVKDKHGKEIYEGDILKSTFSDYTMRVEYDPPRFVLHVNEYDLRNAVYEITRLSELEIIGNIYENPELLK